MNDAIESCASKDRSRQKNQDARRLSRVDLVMDYIKTSVTDGSLQAGDRLPTEFELAEQLGVSRTPVREAIKILDMVGIVEVRHGAGTFVRQEFHSALAQLMLFQSYLKDTTPQKLMEVRQVFERSCAELAAVRRSEDDLKALRESIELSRRLADDPESTLAAVLEADLAFHRLVYRAADNELLEAVANFVLSMVAPWIGKSIERAGPGNAVKLHEVLYVMIESGNASAARELAHSRDLFSGDPVEANMQHFRDTIS